jgi:prepilin-type N-terminal cleavage/methylation domain-containing protein
MTTRARRPSGFTLIELMLASSIAAVIALAAASLAGAIARQVRQVEEQGDIAARTAIAHEFFGTALDGLGYNWRVEDWVSGDILSGAPGEARCHDTGAPPICSNTGPVAELLRPLEVCASNGLSLATCNPPDPTAGSAVRADGIRAVVPRDGVSDAIRIVDRNPAFTGSDCATQVADPIDFTVQGVHANSWTAGDYVLIAGRQHANVGIVVSAFTGEVDPNDPEELRQLRVSIGSGATLDDDDNGYDACDAQVSLMNARVIRIKRVMVRLEETTKTLEIFEKANVNDTPDWVPVLSDVYDLQVQLVANRLRAGGSRACLVQGMVGADGRINQVLYGNEDLQGGCAANEELGRDSDPADNADNDIIRVVGLRVGLLIGAGAQTAPMDRTYPGLFDNAGTVTIASDRRLRREIVTYVGLPNASTY